ncbi:MAG TPA: ATP/GTP-binding protein [Streptosporangiaceae bacterium]|nr:ATP/GTP-binding protein [Streptosporangiaceae bacterium]
MSPRRNRRPAPAASPAPGSEPAERTERTESWPDGEWAVRPVTGAATTKPYRCPGCDQEIVPGTPHVVAWPADRTVGVEERRHWHTPCWHNRLRRRR